MASIFRGRRVAFGLAALMASSGLIALSPANPVSALPPGTPPSGTISVVGSNLTSSSTWALQFDQLNSYCNGDGVSGYRWHGFIAAGSADPAAVTFTATGQPSAPNGAYARPLRRADGSTVTNNTPTTVNGSEGFINLPLDLTFQHSSFGSGFAGSPASGGEFWLGIACINTSVSSTESAEYWATKITATPQAGAGVNNFVFAEGAVPSAPTITNVDASSSAADNAVVTFTPGASDPAATSYTVTATPQGGGTAVTASGAASPITVNGLTTGTTYDFTVMATNTVGNSAPSAPVAATVSFDALPPVTNLDAVAVPGGEVDVTWTAPTGQAPTGYLVSLSPADAAAQTIPFGTNAATFSGLNAGTLYTVTVTPQHPTPLTAESATDTFTALAGSIIVQDLEADRPQGLLLFTQRCGVNDAIAAIPADTLSGFDAAGLPAVGATADQTGTAPIDVDTNAADVNFNEYPYPIDEATGVPNPNYVTECDVEFAPARLVTETGDPYRGQFFRTSAVIDEITVVDTRDTDIGWELSAGVEEFVSGTNTFTGDYLGWQPVVSWTSGDGTTTGNDQDAALPYDQIVDAGDLVAPATPGGLADGETLASAELGEGLGISEHNARLMLLIPLTANAGEYHGTLTYDVI